MTPFLSHVNSALTRPSDSVQRRKAFQLGLDRQHILLAVDVATLDGGMSRIRKSRGLRLVVPCLSRLLIERAPFSCAMRSSCHWKGQGLRRSNLGRFEPSLRHFL